MEKNELPNLVLYEVSDLVKESYKDHFKYFNSYDFKFDLEAMLNSLNFEPALILCGEIPPNIPIVEVAQLLRMNYSSLPIYMVIENKKGLDRKHAQKNGFTDIFLLPIDDSQFRETLTRVLVSLSSEAPKQYESVFLADVDEADKLEFSTHVFLPLNKKFVHFSKKGETLGKEKMIKMSEKRIGQLYIESTEMPKFFKYTAERLKKIGSTQTMSNTEKRLKMSNAIRELLMGVMMAPGDKSSFETGKAFITNCQGILEEYLNLEEKGHLYKKLAAISGAKLDNYGHAGNVSVLASLIAMSLNLDEVSNFALAGLLHDIGISELGDLTIDLSNEDSLEGSNQRLMSHPEMSVNLIKKHRISISQEVLKGIEQHHEKQNGSGYPHKLIGAKINMVAKVLSIADKLDTLLSYKPGGETASPASVVDFFETDLRKSDSHREYDPDLVKHVLSLLKAG